MKTYDCTKGAAPTFTTERLPLAVFLHATERLALLRCEPSDNQKVTFVFHDPEGMGSQVELEFDRGATVTAHALFASQKFLRRLMTKTLNTRSIENRHEYNRHCNSSSL
jgi:hypothetical protein